MTEKKQKKKEEKPVEKLKEAKHHGHLEHYAKDTAQTLWFMQEDNKKKSYGAIQKTWKRKSTVL